MGVLDKPYWDWEKKLTGIHMLEQLVPLIIEASSSLGAFCWTFAWYKNILKF